MVTTEQAREALKSMDQALESHGENASTAYFILLEFISQAESRERLGLAALLKG